MGASAKLLNIIQRFGLLGGKTARNQRKYGNEKAKKLQNLRQQISSAQSNLSSKQPLAYSSMLSRSKSGVSAAQSAVQNARAAYSNARARARQGLSLESTASSNTRARPAPQSYPRTVRKVQTHAMTVHRPPHSYSRA